MAPGSDWPEELDAVQAAPRHHVVLLENTTVRVLETRVASGETVPLHTHRWPGVSCIMSWSDCVRRDRGGAVLMDSRERGGAPSSAAVWSAPLPPHTLENVGTCELRIISVELKGH